VLVLSRKVNEVIDLPTLGVEICLVELSGNRARIGITAPKEIPVHRREVWERIQAEKESDQ